MDLQRRVLRDHGDPFQNSERNFFRHYRFSKDLTRGIIEMMRPFFNVQRADAVAVELKVYRTVILVIRLNKNEVYFVPNK